MVVRLRSLEVVVPDTVLGRGEVRGLFAAQSGMSRLAPRLVGAAFDSSGIETRHSAITELDLLERSATADTPQFFDATTRQILNPSTGVRNDVYVREAARLYVDVAAAALTACEGIDKTDVTHVITVSCTGTFSPRPHYLIVRGLDLEPSVPRHHLVFVAVSLAFPARRRAK